MKINKPSLCKLLRAVPIVISLEKGEKDTNLTGRNTLNLTKWRASNQKEGPGSLKKWKAAESTKITTEGDLINCQRL